MLNFARHSALKSTSFWPCITSSSINICNPLIPVASAAPQTSVRKKAAINSCKMSTAAGPPPIAAKTNGIEKSVWVEFIQLALEVKPLNLGQGFPDFAAPETVTKALAQACMNDSNVLLNQYTRGFGHPRLVSALNKLYSKLIGRELNQLSEILVTAGAYEALFVTIMGLVNPGDEVIIIEPFFDCYVPQVKLAGGTPVFVPLRPKKTSGVTSSEDWVLDPKELANAFSDKTKAIIVNTPNNPLGKVFKVEELMMIADLCKKHNVIAIMDEVYEWMTYTGYKHVRMATLPDMWERTITIGSAGKTFSVTGWKTGWAYGPAELLKGPQVIHQHSVYTCTTPVQEAVAQGFEIELERFGTPDCYFLSLPAELEVKRDNVVRILNEAGLNPIVPEGGYFILADTRSITSKIDIGGDPKERKDFRFVKWLSRNRKLQGIPPSAFYSPDHGHIGEDYIRFCFIKEDENLEKAGQILLELKKDIDAGRV
ncbi:Kynurenine--oxoglutarate transaminase 3 [Halocaridina rubra]|uniref:Kynurenine--oxoglutarate transaminase 3 n=1 Tax=Halocaridina rubra TaxID=373956 RepID=A0AAN8WLG7_HALRR